MRDTAGEFQNVDAALHFALGIGEYLAVFGGDDSRQVVLALLQQLQVAQQHPCAADRRRVAPALECSGGSGYCLIDGGAAGELNVAGHFAGGRIEHLLMAVVARNAGVVDVVLDQGGHGEVSVSGLGRRPATESQ
ncbi:hypothetical protein D3C84_485400 [compost metagenome]